MVHLDGCLIHSVPLQRSTPRGLGKAGVQKSLPDGLWAPLADSGDGSSLLRSHPRPAKAGPRMKQRIEPSRLSTRRPILGKPRAKTTKDMCASTLFGRPFLPAGQRAGDSTYRRLDGPPAAKAAESLNRPMDEMYPPMYPERAMKPGSLRTPWKPPHSARLAESPFLSAIFPSWL